MINTNTLSVQEKQALNRLQDPSTGKVLELLQRELDGAKQKLVYASDTGIIHRLQGRAEAFEDLLTVVKESQKAG
jgi:hypothetical protein